MLTLILSSIFWPPKGLDFSSANLIRALKRSGYKPDPRFTSSRKP